MALPRLAVCAVAVVCGALVAGQWLGCSLLVNPEDLGSGGGRDGGAASDANEEPSGDAASSEAASDAGADGDAAPPQGYCNQLDPGLGWQTLFCDDFDEKAIGDRLDGGWCWRDGGTCWQSTNAAGTFTLTDASAQSPPESMAWSVDAGGGARRYVALSPPQPLPGQTVSLTFWVRVETPPGCAGAVPRCDAIAAIALVDTNMGPDPHYHFWLQLQGTALRLVNNVFDMGDNGGGPSALVTPALPLHEWTEVVLTVRVLSSSGAGTLLLAVSAATGGGPAADVLFGQATSAFVFELGSFEGAGLVRYDGVSLAVTTP